MLISNIYFCLIILGCIFIIISYSRIQNMIYKKLSKEEFKQSLQAYLSYIDKYYIKRLCLTISLVMFYFLSNILLFIFLRMRIINYILKDNNSNIYNLIPIEIIQINYNFWAIFANILNIVLTIMVIIAVKKLLDTILYDEIIKLHIYLLNFEKYRIFILNVLFIFHNINDFFEMLYLFFYNISNLNYKSLPFEFEYHSFNIHDDIYDNEKVVKLSKFCVFLAKKNILFRGLFILLKIISRTFFYHFRITGFIPYVPYLLMFILIYKDVNDMRIYYSAYGVILVYFLDIIIKFLYFIQNKSISNDCDLSDYFYKNQEEYKQLHSSLSTSNLYYTSSILKNIQKLHLIDYIDYVLNNCKNVDHNSFFFVEAKNNAKYRGFCIIIMLFLLFCTLIYRFNIQINFNTYNITFFFLLILSFLFTMMVYFSLKIYRFITDEFDQLDKYRYTRKYVFIFWILVALQSYLYWLLLVKPHIFIVFNDVIWQAYGFEIIKIYTLEEKFMIYKQYFQLLLDVKSLQPYKEPLEILLNNKEATSFIKENTSIYTIKDFVDNVIKNYIYVNESLNYYTVKPAFINFMHEKMDSLVKTGDDFIIVFTVFIILKPYLAFIDPFILRFFISHKKLMLEDNNIDL